MNILPKNERLGLELLLMGKMLLDPSYIKENLAEFTGDGKINEYLGYDVQIKTCSELKAYKSIDSLIPSSTGACVLLIENEPNSGHWVVLLKYHDSKANKEIVEFFNSYGDAPAYEVAIIPDKINEELNQSPSDILNLLDRAYYDGKKVIYNEKKLQKVSGDIGTCGKHCILRSFMLQNYGMNLADYLYFIDWMIAQFERDGVFIDADGLVTLLVDV